MQAKGLATAERPLLFVAGGLAALLLGAALAPAGFRYEQFALHSALEAGAALAELLLAGAIVSLSAETRHARDMFWVPPALAAGSVLDGLHAALLPGAAFYWTRTLATVGCGVLFALGGVAAPFSHAWWRRATVLAGVAAAAVGLVVVAVPGVLPAPLAGRDLTALVVWSNLLGGALCAVAGARFATIAWRRLDGLHAVLAAWCLSYGVTAVLFALAPSWGTVWWLRHGVRVTAGLAVLAYTLTWLGEARDRIGSQTQALRAMSESHRVADLLRMSSEKRLEAIFEHAAIGLALVAPDGAWLRVNGTLCDLVGYREDELVRLTFQDITHPDDLAADVAQAQAVLAGAIDRYSMEKRYIRKDKSVVWILLTVSLVRRADGQPDYFVSAVQDISAMKEVEAERRMLYQELDRRVEERTRELGQANEQLRQSSVFLDSILENIPDMIFLKDAEHRRYVRLNRAGEELLGFPRERVLGRTVFELFPEAQARLFDEQDSAALASSEVVEIVEEDVQTANRGLRVQHTKKLTLRDDDGRPRYLLGIAQDVTERRQAEERIRELNAGLEQRVAERTRELQESNRDLESFSYSVSHDLRAPLRAIQGYAGLLRRTAGELPATAARYLDAIAGTAADAGRQVDALLQFARLGRSELATTVVDSGALVAGVVELVLHGTEGRRIEWGIGPLPPVIGDPHLLRLLWTNLLSNAVKFTRDRDPARIEVSADADGGDRVVFAVRDNGVGFEMAHAKNLFGVFQRLHASAEFPGTGIGLAIARRIVERHGGRIWAEAEPDRGSTFHFYLRAAKPQPT